MDEFNRLLDAYRDEVAQTARETNAHVGLAPSAAREALTEWVRLRVEREPDGWVVEAALTNNSEFCSPVSARVTEHGARAVAASDWTDRKTIVRPFVYIDAALTEGGTPA